MAGRPVEPAQVRGDCQCRHRWRIAGHDVAAHQHRAGYARRTGPADERGERPCHRARDQPEQADPQSEADACRDGQRVARQVVERIGGRPCCQGHDRHHNGHAGHVRCEFLYGDAALAEGRSRDHVQAAATSFSGERARQRQDRPDPHAYLVERSVLPGEVAANRADIDRVARDAPQSLRDVVDEARQFGPRRERRVGGVERDRRVQQQPAQQATQDDQGEARVAHRLGVDGAEAPNAASERNRRSPRKWRAASLDGHQFFLGDLALSTGNGS